MSIGSHQNTRGDVLDLSQFQWKNRLLFLFAPDRNQPFFDHLHRSIVEQAAEIQDRDLVIFEIFESGPSHMDMVDLDLQTTRLLREKFAIQKGDFSVILIGKDGGIKLNRREQTNLEDIFGLIDAMPMRREEIRRKD